MFTLYFNGDILDRQRDVRAGMGGALPPCPLDSGAGVAKKLWPRCQIFIEATLVGFIHLSSTPLLYDATAVTGWQLSL